MVLIGDSMPTLRIQVDITPIVDCLMAPNIAPASATRAVERARTMIRMHRTEWIRDSARDETPTQPDARVGMR